MNEATRHKLIWGWLRLFLGWAQMSLAVFGAVLLFTVGLHLLTWISVVGATAATVTSRLLYHGRPDPRLNDRKGQD